MLPVKIVSKTESLGCTLSKEFSCRQPIRSYSQQQSSIIQKSIRPPHDKAVHPLKAQSTQSEQTLIKEEHKFYDEAIITVRAGRGGDGQILEKGAGKQVKNYKYNPGRNTPKQIWLPASDPADGGAGGDVILECDPSVDSLLDFYSKSVFSAKRGPHGNPEDGSQAPKALTRSKRPKRSAPPCIIKVPPGTVVKRKGTGQLIGELVSPGQTLLVAKGGRGGFGAVVPSKKKARTVSKRRKRQTAEKIDLIDEDWKADTFGLPGEERTLQLLLRVVADVGLVGLPNVGKSSLLAAMSRARPEIAPYPFTTLMPNLGVMGKGGDPVLVDLPGLIEGAHVGRGLGRQFLRHLRRTRILVQVVDVSQPDPISDYISIREELRMYNPQYCERDHIVALNQIDKIESVEVIQDLKREILSTAESLRNRFPAASVPKRVILTSAVTGEGVQELQEAIQDAVGDLNGEEEFIWDR